LKIKTEEEFRARFERSPLRRPKRRGLLRNALVVLGNKRPAEAADAIHKFVKEETDPMLVEHAQWALAQFG
jgi:epoxyqueuosine reductase